MFERPVQEVHFWFGTLDQVSVELLPHLRSTLAVISLSIASTALLEQDLGLDFLNFWQDKR